MIISHKLIDINTWEPGKPKYVPMQRKPGQIWCVPSAPVQLTTRIDWTTVRQGDRFFVKLFGYLAPNDPVRVLGYAFELGARALVDAPTPPKELQVLLALPAESVTATFPDQRERDALRCWFNFAFLL